MGPILGGNERIQVYGHFEEFPDLVMHCLKCSSVGTYNDPCFPLHPDFIRLTFDITRFPQGKLWTETSEMPML